MTFGRNKITIYVVVVGMVYDSFTSNGTQNHQRNRTAAATKFKTFWGVPATMFSHPSTGETDKEDNHPSVRW
jgi:hypothetical protein